ncbi:MAG: hypothetical protein ACREME_11160, partial [Gemmatimonadales bacterium]
AEGGGVADRQADGSAERPFATLQRGLDAARPGDTVLAAAGTYEGMRSVRSGEPGAPIVLRGDPGAIIDGRGEANNLVEFTHSHLVLRGFELTGADKLVVLIGASQIRILGNLLYDAEGECLRLRYHSSRNEIAGNRIVGCGRTGFDLDEDSKNGEGVYIGTAPEQLDDKNPTDEPDTSAGNWVHDNEFEVPAECVDVKEDAVDNLVERNRCTGSEDPDGAGFSSRGIGTVFRYNYSHGHVGDGIRLGGDDDDDGVRTVVRDNRLVGNDGYGLSVHRLPQGEMCGNDIGGNALGALDMDVDTDEDARRPDPSRPCR